MDFICTLSGHKAKTAHCKQNECSRCAWEVAEGSRRRAYLKAQGMTLCADGLRRLILQPTYKDFLTAYAPRRRAQAENNAEDHGKEREA